MRGNDCSSELPDTNGRKNVIRLNTKLDFQPGDDFTRRDWEEKLADFKAKCR